MWERKSNPAWRVSGLDKIDGDPTVDFLQIKISNRSNAKFWKLQPESAESVGPNGVLRRWNLLELGLYFGRSRAANPSSRFVTDAAGDAKRHTAKRKAGNQSGRRDPILLLQRAAHENNFPGVGPSIIARIRLAARGSCSSTHACLSTEREDPGSKLKTLTLNPDQYSSTPS